MAKPRTKIYVPPGPAGKMANYQLELQQVWAERAEAKADHKKALEALAEREGYIQQQMNETAAEILGLEGAPTGELFDGERP